MKLALPLPLVLAFAAGCSSTPGLGGAGAGGSHPAASSSRAAAGGGGVGGGDAGVVPCDEAGIDKGPWSNAMASTSVRVRWNACRADSDRDVYFTPEGGGAEARLTSTVTPYEVSTSYSAPLNPDEPPDVAGTYYLNEVTLTGLSPGTCYTYRLGADAGRAGRFCTARPSGDPFKFFSIGDTDPGLGDSTVHILAQTMPMNPDFTVHGGDLQYYSSGLETWSYWFLRMAPLLRQGAFFPAIGNHETEEQNPAEYTDYTQRLFGDAGFDGDTTHYRFESGGVWFFALDTEGSIDLASPEGAWLSANLADASIRPGYRFSVVYMHRPLVTCGDAGDDPITRAQLEPLFLEYKVPLVIQAHMHGYERFEFGAITYVTSAGGGGLLGDPDGNAQRSYCGSRVASGAFRFGVLFEVDANGFGGTVVDEYGAVRDTFTHALP